MITTKQVRQKYLNFFKSKNHQIIPSVSLLPENDPTTLFTGSGMQPMVPYLLGEKHPLGTRIADSQKCFRAEDIEEVGDNQHTTFFEMLGNWSLGDYFKQEQIPWIFEFLTQELKLDPKRIYVTVFRGRQDIGIPKDIQAVKIWQKEFEKVGIKAKDVDLVEKNGMQDGRIFYYDENWWARIEVPEDMPIGEPGGPDSEMFWDFGEHLKIHENSQYKNQPCHPNCDCGRFMEIGNSVFMSYVKTEKGFEELPKKNIDFGGGLERVVAAVNDNPDMFLIDTFRPLIQIIEDLSHKKYKYDKTLSLTKGEMEGVAAFQVIMDHIKGATFLINDGALPSNKDQGYFTRRLIRRAIRHAAKLGIHQNFCGKIARQVIEIYQNHYTDLKTNQSSILSELEKEEDKFRQTLQNGLKEFGREIEKLEIKKLGNKLSGKTVFDLYQSYGFPIELTKELAQEKGLEIDENGFNLEFKKHQELSRTASEGKFKGGLTDHSEINIKYHTATHLLHQALRQILGDHVQQRGSNINPERLRFDFSHPEKLTDQQKKEVEDLVNQKIQANLPVTQQEMTQEEAKNLGAIGLFGSKYGQRVKVYTIGNPQNPFSREICGGPHVENIGSLGHFRITKEQASSAGIRRIKAVLE